MGITEKGEWVSSAYFEHSNNQRTFSWLVELGERYSKYLLLYGVLFFVIKIRIISMLTIILRNIISLMIFVTIMSLNFCFIYEHSPGNCRMQTQYLCGITENAQTIF